MDGVNINALIAGVGRPQAEAFDYASAKRNALQSQLMQQQVEAQPYARQLDEQTLRLRELALDIKARAMEAGPVGKPISLDYDFGTITGLPENLAGLAAAVAQFPDQAKGPEFNAYLAQKGVSFKGKESKVSPYGPEALDFAKRKAQIEAQYKEPKAPPEKYTKDDAVIAEALRDELGREPTAREVLDEKTKRAQLNSPNIYIGTDESGNPLTMKSRGAPTVTPAEMPEGAKVQPKPSHMPSEMVVAEQQISTLQTTLDRVDSNYDSSYVGPVAGRLGEIKEQWTGIPEKQAMFYADLAQINNSLVYLMSGKQINEQEYKRLLKQLPVANLPEGVFKSRMKTFKETLKSILEERHKNMKSRGMQPSGKKENTIGRFKIEVE